MIVRIWIYSFLSCDYKDIILFVICFVGVDLTTFWLWMCVFLKYFGFYVNQPNIFGVWTLSPHVLNKNMRLSHIDPRQEEKGYYGHTETHGLSFILLSLFYFFLLPFVLPLFCGDAGWNRKGSILCFHLSTE